MGFLGIFGFCFVYPWPGERIFLAVRNGDDVVGIFQGHAGEVDTVGTHVGDQTDRAFGADIDPLVQLLRRGHGLLGRKTEFARRLLLQSRGSERGRRISFLLALRDLGNLVAARLQRCFQRRRNLFTRNIELAEFFASHLHQAGLELLARRHPKTGGDCPVLLLFKGKNFLLALADQTERHRLDATGGESVADLFPEERREVETDQIIQNRTGLLGIHEIKGNVARIFNRMQDRLFGDFMELDPLDLDAGVLLVEAERRQQMPGDCLTFTVGVGCEKQPVRPFERGLDRIEVPLAFRQHMIFRFESLADIDGPLFARQSPHMSERGKDFKSRSQEFFYGFSLGGRFNNDEAMRHK